MNFGDALTTALSVPGEATAEILILRDVNHLSITETAQILGLSEANVKTRLSRARLQMRDALASGFAGLWSGRSCEKVQTSENTPESHSHDHGSWHLLIEAVRRLLTYH